MTQWSDLIRRSLMPGLLLAAVVLLPGCLRVVRDQAPYYLHGPHQVAGPDGFLSSGTRVLVFGRQESYARILTFDGVAAHVLSDSLVTPGQWRSERRRASEGKESVIGTPADKAR